MKVGIYMNSSYGFYIVVDINMTRVSIELILIHWGPHMSTVNCPLERSHGNFSTGSVLFHQRGESKVRKTHI